MQILGTDLSSVGEELVTSNPVSMTEDLIDTDPPRTEPLVPQAEGDHECPDFSRLHASWTLETNRCCGQNRMPPPSFSEIFEVLGVGGGGGGVKSTMCPPYPHRVVKGD